MKTHVITLAMLASTFVVNAQVTYVDAVAGGNTTLADGSLFVPNPATNGADDNWTQRAFANGGTVFESNNPTVVPFEDAPMLRTTITGLIPTFHYSIYGYFWVDTGGWRGRGLVSTTQPSPPLPGYNTRHFNGSAFDPMTPLVLGSPVGDQQVSRDIPFDAAGFSTGGYFASPVLIRDGNRWLFEAPLGHFPADQNGEITVYIDDLEGATTTSNRTWYDGVGYALAVPDRIGTGCGTPAVPTIDFVGSTLPGGGTVSLQLASAPASVPCTLVIGFSNLSWAGLPLPFDFGSFGFAGCELHVSYDVSVSVASDAAGAASVSLQNNGLFGVPIYWQWLALDTAAPSPLYATRAMVVTFE